MFPADADVGVFAASRVEAFLAHLNGFAELFAFGPQAGELLFGR